jgi:peroxiredoxin
MAQLEPFQDEIERAGATLAYVAAEKREGFFKPVDFLAQHPVSFPFLLDEGRQVTKAFGVYHRLGKDAFNIARPATFVIGRDGMVRWIYVGMDQRDRARIEAVLKVAREMAA